MATPDLQLSGARFPHPLGKIVCVGRNFAAHAAELNNPLPEVPLLFIKPATAAADIHQPIAIPDGLGSVHHELEITVLIGAPLTRADRASAASAIAGIGLALDLTLRDVQDQLKRDGHPWERAKAFDGAFPMSEFVTADGVDLRNLSLRLWRNGALAQEGNSNQMLFPILDLVTTISHTFSLMPGDVVATGTPAGVGPLTRGDQLVATLDGLIRVETSVA
ncbi:MAG: fumarylacetoacetate hydrolase family protein [Spongiibacteraceae bacterium]|jgi:2-keto-4-pentenoate hydratase/2-oxohepta-3-ene-1,7-dioic acid hydratase in catechol pathway|nr:fumarylacetoacetate hydrolase family protein [Spongiibacteraceae bacterium]